MYYSVQILLCVVCVVSDGEATSLVSKHPNWKYLDTKHCGITKYDNQQTRIVRGNKAMLGEFPWIVRLGIKYEDINFILFTCGGTLINKHYVLTAAHCLTKNTVVRIGENHATNNTDCDGTSCAPPVQDIKIRKYIEFGYQKKIRKRDLMLVLLEGPVRFNEYVVPACLPHGAMMEANYLGKHVQIAGWGYTNSTLATMPDDLMFISAPILNNDVCNDIYISQLDETQFCAGYNTGRDSCAGDSGGPMTKRLKINGTGQHYLLGIVSFGKRVCGSGPAVYTKVAHYMGEILDRIEDH